MQSRRPWMATGCFYGVLISLILVLTGCAQETTQLDDELQNAMTKLCQEQRLPAMWAGCFVDGKIPALSATGVLKVDTQDEAKIDDRVHLGSCTKAMTAAMIGQLCTEGKLQLDSSLHEVFPELQSLESSEWGKVTVLELLQHRSGAPANVLYPLLDQEFPNRPDLARRKLLEQIASTKRPRVPTYLYSNVGYILLGHVIESIDKRPWEEAIQERLFRPLEIESAGFGPVGQPDDGPTKQILPSRAWGHVEAPSLVDMASHLLGITESRKLQPVQVDNSPCLSPAGRVHMNMMDWSKFTIQFAKEDGYAALKIAPDVWETMLKPPPDSKSESAYAAGWIALENPQFHGKLYFHNGSNGSWYCYAVAIPSKKATILVATNYYSNGARKACDQMARKIAATLTNVP